MKSKIILLSFVLIASISVAQTKQINFEHGTFAELKAKAKKENKLIFIDAYTTWCGPCKWMAKEVFTNDTVADYYNSKFINAKIDMEKGEGIEIAKIYDVRCYPNLLFIDGDGKLIHRTGGALGNKAFIEFGGTAQNPEKRFSALQSQYAAKKNDADFLYNYLKIIGSTCLDFNEVTEAYFKTQKEEDLTSEKNWVAINNYVQDFNSKEFSHVTKNIDVYKKAHGDKAVEDYIYFTSMNAAYNLIYLITKDKSNEAKFSELKKGIQNLNNFTSKDKLLFKIDMAYLEGKQDWDNYIKASIKDGDKMFSAPDEFNNISWTIYEHSNDKNALLKAEEWMKKVVADTKEYAFQDTYAAILYKLNKKSEAKDAAIKAIEMAKESGLKEEDYKATKELLEKSEKLN